MTKRGEHRLEISGRIENREVNVDARFTHTHTHTHQRGKREKKYSASVAPRICCVSDKSRSGNLQIAKRTGIRIHVDDDGNVNTYTRNDVATHVPSVTHLRGSRPLALRDARRLRGTHGIRIPTKMRIHFLQNVSHSAAHYRRNEKGMMHRGNSNKEDISGTKERGRERENISRGVRRGKEKRTKGPARRAEGKKASLNISRNKEKCDSAEARPQHFCLYKIMYSAGLRHISQSITSSLCVSRSSISPSSPLRPSSPTLPIVSSFAVLSPGSLQPGRDCLSFLHVPRSYISVPRLSQAAAVSVRLRLSARVTSTPTHAGDVHVFPRIHPRPSLPSDKLSSG